MKKMLSFLILSVLFLSGCVSTLEGPQPVGKSLYLNKRLMKFVMDNGPAYREQRLSNGHVLHYWRSDTGRLIAIAAGRDDQYPDLCELALETDEKNVIRRINIIEDSPICMGVLK